MFLLQLRAAWIIPFFCYQIFDFALNALVAVSIVVYPNTIQDYLQQLVRKSFVLLTHVFLSAGVCQWCLVVTDVLLSPVQPDNFPYKEEVGALSNVCLALIVLLFIGCILGFKVTLYYSTLHIFLIHTYIQQHNSLQACNIMCNLVFTKTCGVYN